MNIQLSSIKQIIANLKVNSGSEILTAFTKESAETFDGERTQALVAVVRKAFLTRGIGAGERILIFAPNSVAWVSVALAVFDAGCVLVPIDAQLNAEDLQHVLQDAEPSLIITSANGQGVIEGLFPSSGFSYFLMDEVENHPSGLLLPIPEAVPWPSETVAIFYTSGTSGPPKGVPLSDSNLVYQVNAAIDSGIITRDDRILLPLPTHHIYPFVLGLLTPLAVGAPVILPYELTGPELLRAIKVGRVTVLVGVPRLFSSLYSGIEKRIKSLGLFQSAFIMVVLQFCSLIRTCGGPLFGKLLLSSIHQGIGPTLRLLTTGGAHLDENLQKKLESLGWQVAIGYGLTETSPLISFKLPNDSTASGAGKPLAGTEVKVLAISEKLQREVSGELGASVDQKYGEILVRGPGVFKGYRHLPEITNSVLDRDGWFHTGDFGYFQKDSLHVMGRATSLIVTESGKKIDPEALEGHYKAHPLIQEIGIFQNRGKLVAVVVPEKELISRADADIHRLLNDAIDAQALRLPSYKRLSGYAISSTPLPKTPIGKIQRHRLPQLYTSLISGRNSADQVSVNLPSELDDEILQDPLALKIYDLLANRYHKKNLRLDASLQLDLGIDSLEWIDLSMDIEDLGAMRLRQESLSSVRTVRDLLVDIVAQSIATRSDPRPTLPQSLSPSDLRWLKPLNTFELVLATIFSGIIYVVMKVFFVVRVEGLQNLPEKGNVIFTPNHASFIDPFALGAAIPIRMLLNTYWAAWVGIAFANPLVSAFSRLGRLIPIDADHALLTSIALAISLLETHRNLVWFPEGRRTLTGELIDFRPGIGLLIQRSPTQIIPVYLHGTAQALPPGSWLPRPHVITVIFGKPESIDSLVCDREQPRLPERIALAIKERVQGLRNKFEKLEKGISTAPTQGENLMEMGPLVVGSSAKPQIPDCIDDVKASSRRSR
jgi:long-chain acyl-CoA synthetase